MLTYGMENQSIRQMHIWDTKQIETPQLRGLEVIPQLMRSETIIFFIVDFTIYRTIKDIKKEK